MNDAETREIDRSETRSAESKTARTGDYDPPIATGSASVERAA
jgi:hypothetical protein